MASLSDEERKRLGDNSCRIAANFAPEERSFSPHLTLARIKGGERQVGQTLAQSGLLEWPASIGTLPVEAIAFIKSELRQTGSVYTKLWECRLAPRAV